jgi:cell division protein FtsQ
MRRLSANDDRMTRIVRGGPSAPQGRRAGPRRSRRTPAILCAAIVGTLGCLAAVTIVLANSGWFDRQLVALNASIIDVSSEWGFNVRRVLADGRDETSSGQILRAIDVRIGQPILSVDLKAARERLEELPWVEQATIERRLPDTLYVRLRESEPLALWQKQQRFFLVSRTGRVIDEPRIARFANLLVIVGPDAPAHVGELLELMSSQPALGQHVVAAVRVGGRRWNLRLDNGIDVKLPEADGVAAWRELARLDREQGILARDLSVIDMRVPDRLIVRLAPGAGVGEVEPGDDT